MIPSWRVSRRTFLRGMAKGAAVAIGLPLLEAMTAPSLWAGDPPGAVRAAPRRLATLFFPNGVHPMHWTPAAVGPLGVLPAILTPLEKAKQDVLVLSGLWHKAVDSGDGHYFKDAAFLTGSTITKTTGSDVNVGGTSLDQVIAARIGHLTRLPSLELGTESPRSGVDNNVQITQLYGGHVSWSSPTTPIASEIEPKAAFDRLFRPRGQQQAGKGPAQLGPLDDISVLDGVIAEANALRAKVGIADRRKLDEYLTSVRDIERRIKDEVRREKEPRRVDPAAIKGLPALEEQARKLDRRDPAQGHQAHVRLMLDLLAMAFWTDSTRVGTFMFGISVSGRNFSFLPGVTSGHHDCSHHDNQADKLAMYQTISTWHVEQLAYFLDRLRSIKEGQGTLLDNSLVLFGSGLRDGNAHSPRDLPIILAGHGGGTIKPGRHLARKDGALCDLYLEVLQRMGVPDKSFGDSGKGMPEIAG